MLKIERVVLDQKYLVGIDSAEAVFR